MLRKASLRYGWRYFGKLPENPARRYNSAIENVSQVDLICQVFSIRPEIDLKKSAPDADFLRDPTAAPRIALNGKHPKWRRGSGDFKAES